MHYIDQRRDVWGVEPICRALQFASQTYHATKARSISARALRDAELRVEILRVYEENRRVYGADKIWAQLNREGTRVARCTVERLMRQLGIQGIRRGRRWKTTIPDQLQARPSDLVERDFSAPAPNRLWVADWRGPDDIEWATLTYIHWYNHTRLHGEIGMRPPAEYEHDHYSQTRPAETTEPQQTTSL